MIYVIHPDTSRWEDQHHQESPKEQEYKKIIHLTLILPLHPLQQPPTQPDTMSSSRHISPGGGEQQAAGGDGEQPSSVDSVATHVYAAGVLLLCLSLAMIYVMRIMGVQWSVDSVEEGKDPLAGAAPSGSPAGRGGQQQQQQQPGSRGQAPAPEVAPTQQNGELARVFLFVDVDYGCYWWWGWLDIGVRSSL